MKKFLRTLEADIERHLAEDKALIGRGVVEFRTRVSRTKERSLERDLGVGGRLKFSRLTFRSPNTTPFVGVATATSVSNTGS